MGNGSQPVAFRDDLWGGLAAALVAVPSSIAFGVVVYTAIGPEHAGEGALAGILGAAAMGIVAPLIGRNGGFISAPCAPAAAVMSTLAAGLTAESIAPGRVKALMALVALLAALLQVLLGSIRAGRLIKFIPYQVVSGYLSGVAVIIGIGQLPKLLGLPAGVTLRHGLTDPSLWRWPGVVVGVVTIVVVVFAPRLVKAVPAAILGLLAGITSYFGLALIRPELLRVTDNPLVIGPFGASGSLTSVMTERFQALAAVRPVDLATALVPALTLAVLLSIDTLKTGVVLDALTRTRHNSNRELLGQGVGNIVSLVAGGMPGAGTMGPTLVNVTSGGRSPRSGIAEGLFVVAALVVLGSFISWVPISALAGILLVVSWRMFDFKMFRLILRPSTRLDFAVIAAVVVVAESVGLIQASALGVGLAILLFIRDQIHGPVVSSRRTLRQVSSKRGRLAAERQLLVRHGDEGVLVQLQGNLFFGTTDRLFGELEQDLARARYLLFDLRRVQSMDYTAAQLMTQMRQRLAERGGHLLFSGMPTAERSGQDIERYLGQLGLLGGDGGSRVFATRDGALEWVEDHLLAEAGWSPPGEERPLDLGEVELLHGISHDAIERLREAAREIALSPGERLFQRGDEEDELYLVRSGRLHVLLPLEGGKRHHLATICRGDFFGEVAFLDRGPRSADTEAATATLIYALSRASFDHIAETDPALGVVVLDRLARGLSHRLRIADVELRSLEER